MQDRAAEIEERLRALLSSYGKLLRAAIARHCPRNLGLQADDIEQDAVVRLWKALSREREIDRPASYLYRIAVTATVDAVRSAKARREETMGHQATEEDRSRPEPATRERDSPEAVASRRELERSVVEAVSTLSGARGDAVRLHLQGFTSREIGELLGWTEPKARNLTSRGLRDLRIKLLAKGIDHDAAGS